MMLLEDMLKLQSNDRGAFGQIPKDEIYIDFLSGLIACGKFRLAREILLPLDGTRPLDAAASEKLIIDSSREFFDNASSGNMHHGYMRMAYEW
jgi:hypothetical protein